ncbi:ABC transporter ATP-binding protein [Cuneatibacter sp. NSJ-177]|uniref:ABC transporter ATP-binding protein n=1 Tax=Cuneatibacter sp. NSJ-177 TaxID=2931401 RepID=UPI001FD2E2A0|nr:ABC transporter ATP-binding protein [Cuneatibacter sp. NSJ-177]MCJ7837095.1 ABC transporter ATP-binding protein [Cuneatibacter sp. NSJ-177]
MSKDILTAKDLKQYFPVGKDRFVRAVDGVNFTIQEGEVMGLVGESGSGKSTIAYTVMGMYQQTGGEIIFNGKTITPKTKGRSKEFRREVQIVFQDPGSSLNPYQDVKQILSLPLKVHNIVPKNEIEDKILEILEMVELPPDFMYKSPGSIGGGERQLVSIARALCSNPKFIILDEPTSSLDVSIQAKILNMLMKLHEEQKLTYLFITHDMGVMRNVSTKIAIMYLGKICEIAPTKTFYEAPLHPYTQMLLSAIPVISEEEEALKPKRIRCEGEIPSPVNLPKGCSFHTRCMFKKEICMREDPVMKEVEPGHFVRCHLCDPDAPAGEKKPGL